MSEQPIPQKYAELSIRHSILTKIGRGTGCGAKRIREQMEMLWEEMTEKEREDALQAIRKR